MKHPEYTWSHWKKIKKAQPWSVYIVNGIELVDTGLYSLKGERMYIDIDQRTVWELDENEVRRKNTLNKNRKNFF